MSAETPAIVRTFPVGRYTCTLTIPRPRPGELLHMASEWSPAMPPRLSQAEMAQYRAGRNAALAELAQLTGLKAAVVEL